MSHISYGSPSPGDIKDSIFDIGLDFVSNKSNMNKCNKNYEYLSDDNNGIIVFVNKTISNHIGNFKTLTDKGEIKTKLLSIKHKVENKLDKKNECDKHIIEYYFEKKDEDIMKSRVKKALFGKSTPTPSKSIFGFLTSRNFSRKGKSPSRKSKSPSRGGKTKKKRHCK